MTSNVLPKKTCFEIVAFILLVGLSTVVLTSSAIAQLTDDDISVLQDQAAEEGWTFTVGKNAATEYSLDQLTGLVEPENWREGANFNPMQSARHIPQFWDWREMTGLPPIRNQGSCGSCWAFATVGPLECAIHIQDGNTVDLSEQYLVSCNNHGWDCITGGWFAYDYFWWYGVAGEPGAVLEQDFPYTATDGGCAPPYPHEYVIDGWGYIGDQSSIASTPAMKQAIMEYGPISVAVAANSAMQSYTGGIFSGCDGGDINHAVTIVGWDDTLGGSGCWIMRNSWGAGWGDNGYMYIRYGCQQIGYAACYVEYSGGVSFEADTTFGWVPYDVNFTATSGQDSIDSWCWSFGDGDSSEVISPSHTFDSPGMHTVNVKIDCNGTEFSRERVNYVIALADSIVAPALTGERNTTIEMSVYARNSVPLRMIELPIEYSGDLDLTLDTFIIAGTRTEAFEQISLLHYSPSLKRTTLRLIASPSDPSAVLAPGTGEIIKLYFSVSAYATIGASTEVNLAGYTTHQPLFAYDQGSYAPIITSSAISICAARGDMDNMPGITVNDLTWFTNFLFKGGADPIPLDAGDIDGDTEMNVSDLTYLVSYLFRGGPLPPTCSQ